MNTTKIKLENMKKYICEKCKRPCSQLYGNKIDGKYTEECVLCAFPKRKNENKKGKKELSRNSK